QAGILQLRRRSLREGGIRRHAAPDTSPDVDLPGHIDRYGVKATRSGTRTGWRGGRGGKQASPGDARRRFGRAELCLGGQYVLVRDAYLVFERVQPRIVVNLPPLAAKRSVIGLRFLPTGRWRFFEGRRRRGPRTPVLGPG